MIKAVIVMKILLNYRGTIIHDGLDPPTHPETNSPDVVLFLHFDVTFIYPGQNQLRQKKQTYRSVTATVVLPYRHPYCHLLTGLPIFFTCGVHKYNDHTSHQSGSGNENTSHQSGSSTQNTEDDAG